MSGKPLLVTQKQVAAVLKGAVQAGIHLEVRIENGVVRFVPCEVPAPARIVDRRQKGYF